MIDTPLDNEAPPTYRPSRGPIVATGKRKNGYEVLPLQDGIESEADVSDFDGENTINLSLEDGIFSGQESDVGDVKALCEQIGTI